MQDSVGTGEFLCPGTGWGFLSCLVLLCVSLMQESGIKVREALAKQNLYFRWVIYLCALFSLILFGVYGLNYDAADFIYRGF